MINFLKIKDEIYKEIKDLKQKDDEHEKKEGETVNETDLKNMNIDETELKSNSSKSSTSFDIVSKFKLPIFYLEKKHKLSDSIKNDLEISDDIYKVFIRNTNKLSSQTIPLFYDYYTTDSAFLKESQKLIKTLPLDEYKATCNLALINDSYEAWEYIKTLQNFNEHYDFLDYERLETFNTYESFLQIMSIYMLASPVLSLLTPFLLLLVPFFLLKLRGHSISVANYTSSLRKIIVNIPIGKLLNFSSMSNGDKAYALISASFYIYQIYQNCMYCKRFFKNINYMYDSI